MTQSENQFSLLALCAKAQGHPTQYQHLREQAANLTDWNTIPTQTESHGLTPLVYTHLQAAGIPIPDSIKEQLHTRAMQHSHANRIRTKTLASILAAFQTAGIDVLVLKGAAMAHLVYPEPGHSMPILKQAVTGAITLKSKRGEAGDVAIHLLARITNFETRAHPCARLLREKHSQTLGPRVCRSEV